MNRKNVVKQLGMTILALLTTVLVMAMVVEAEVSNSQTEIFTIIVNVEEDFTTEVEKQTIGSSFEELQEEEKVPTRLQTAQNLPYKEAYSQKHSMPNTTLVNNYKNVISINTDVTIIPDWMTYPVFSQMIDGLPSDRYDILKTHKEKIWEDAVNYGINPTFVVAILAEESGWCTDEWARACHNYGGIKEKGELKEYSSDEEFFKDYVKRLYDTFLNPRSPYYNGTTIQSINIRYNPMIEHQYGCQCFDHNQYFITLSTSCELDDTWSRHIVGCMYTQLNALCEVISI